MKIRNITILTCMFALTLAFSASAQEKKDTKSADAKSTQTSEAATATSDSVEVIAVDLRLGNQTHCPVMGGEIDSSSYTDIQGQRVYHCCDMCTAKLTADPDTYFKKAAADGIRFENNQTACPVSGEALEDDTYLDYEGRRVFLCCDKCVKMFKKNPAKYLSALTTASAEVDTKKTEPKKAGDHSGHDHSGHNH